MEGEKFKLRNLPLRTSSLLCSSANSIGTSLEFAAFGSGPDAKYSRASAFWNFLSTTMVFAAVRTHFSRKTPSCLSRGINSRISVKINNSENEHVELRFKHGAILQKGRLRPLETLRWFQSNFVMVDADVTVTQLISSRMFVCLFEQRMNTPRIK